MTFLQQIQRTQPEVDIPGVAPRSDLSVSMECVEGSKVWEVTSRVELQKPVVCRYVHFSVHSSDKEKVLNNDNSYFNNPKSCPTVPYET